MAKPFVYNEVCSLCNVEFETNERMHPKLYSSLVTWQRGVRYHSSCLQTEDKERCTEGELFIPDGMVHEGNLDQVKKENEALKQRRIDCLRATVEWMDALKVPYWISDGTLLGALREGGIIDVDIDTDVSILVTEFEKLFFGAAQLPDGYVLDCVSTEIDWSCHQSSVPFVPEPGKRGWKQFCVVDVRDYSHIIKETMRPETDIYTFYVDQLGFLRSNYSEGNQAVHERRFRYWDVFPLGKIEFEGKLYSAPNNPFSYLKELYGYLGRNAYWDRDEKRYKKLPNAPVDPFDPSE